MRQTCKGMHFQYKPYAENKLIFCLKGEIFDVAVDVRRDSPTFLHWHSEILSASNHRSFFIPEGFAHGYQALTENCEMLYLHSQTYQPDAEGGLNALDPDLAITWPLEVTEQSIRDQQQPMLSHHDFREFV